MDQDTVDPELKKFLLGLAHLPGLLLLIAGLIFAVDMRVALCIWAGVLLYVAGASLESQDRIKSLEKRLVELESKSAAFSLQAKEESADSSARPLETGSP